MSSRLGLEELKKLSDRPRGQLPPQENFALVVAGYSKDDKGRDVVSGMRADTGEDVSVVLRPYTRALKAARNEIKDFVASAGEVTEMVPGWEVANDKRRAALAKALPAQTEPGGTLLIQRAYIERDTGKVNAGWIEAVSKFQGHAKVLGNVMLRVDPVSRRTDSVRGDIVSVTATVIYPDRAVKVTSVDELASALKAVMAEESDIKARPHAVMRVSEAAGTPAAIEFTLPMRQDPASREWSSTTPDEAVSIFLKSEQGKVLSGIVGADDIDGLQVEVIPGHRIPMGSQSKASFENGPNGIEHVNRHYRIAKDDVEKTGFAMSYVVLNESTGNRVHVFSNAEPLSYKPAIYEARDIPTPNYGGQASVIVQRIAEEPKLAAPVHAAVPEDMNGYDDDEEFEVSDAVAQSASAAHRPRL